MDVYIVNAKKNIRIHKWQPISPAEFLQLIRISNSRIITNENHLLEVVIESLMRLDKKLQGENANSIFLWDRKTKDKLRPKPENDLSDYIKGHLIEDLSRIGIGAFREVEIRRRTSEDGIPGERTDIYVACFNLKTEKWLKLIIEVKGCWNADVRKAMKEQLLDRYLDKNELNYGIYLVGYYNCIQWDGNDKGSKNMTEIYDDAVKFFEEQSKELSDDKKTIKSFVLDCRLK